MTMIKRKRTQDDDIKTIRGKPRTKTTPKGISIPEKSKSPLTLWTHRMCKYVESMTDDEVVELMNWPSESKHKCMHCTYAFSGVPVPLPLAFDERRLVYLCSKNFCSWNCSKAYNMNLRDAHSKNRSMYISLLAYQTYYKFHVPINKDDHVIAKHIYNGLKCAPSIECLIDYGGSLTIEEYRSDFVGIIPPYEMFKKYRLDAMKPYVSIRQREMLAFSKSDTVSVGTKKIDAPSGIMKMKMIEQVTIKPWRESMRVRLKEQQDIKTERKNLTDLVLKREKPVSTGSNTLITSMGIKISKHQR